MTEIEASRFTRRGALRKADRLNAKARANQKKGRSSGWSRISYGIAKRTGLRPWKVVAR